MIRILTSLVLLCFGITAVQAQSADVQFPTDSVAIAQLTEKVSRLEKRGERWDKILAHLPKLGGYAQVGYQGATGSSSFQVKSVRLWLTGDFAPKVDYMLQVELVSPRLLDAFIRYRPFDALHLQLGEFKLPFTIENTMYTPMNYEFIDYPMGLTRLGALNDLCGIASTGRDLGFMASGGFFKKEGRHILSYDIGVFNGEGVNAMDKNTSKDVVGRLMIRPVRGLLLAGYYYWGEYGAEYLKRIRYGGGACYDRGMIVARGEYVGGTTGMPGGGCVLSYDQDSDSWYAMAGIRPVKSVTIAARYDTFVTRHVSNSRQTNYTLGLTWDPVKHLRCQLNYTYEDFKSSSVQNRNVVTVMFTGIL